MINLLEKLVFVKLIEDGWINTLCMPATAMQSEDDFDKSNPSSGFSGICNLNSL
jgi:hypothetical protein